MRKWTQEEEEEDDDDRVSEKSEREKWRTDSLCVRVFGTTQEGRAAISLFLLQLSSAVQELLIESIFFLSGLPLVTRSSRK